MLPKNTPRRAPRVERNAPSSRRAACRPESTRTCAAYVLKSVRKKGLEGRGSGQGRQSGQPRATGLRVGMASKPTMKEE